MASNREDPDEVMAARRLWPVGLTLLALVPGLAVSWAVLTCTHSGEHWEQLAMLGAGPLSLVASLLPVPWWFKAPSRGGWAAAWFAGAAVIVWGLSASL